MHWNFLPHLKMESQMPDATTTEGKLYFKNLQPLMTRPKYQIQSDPTKCDHQCIYKFGVEKILSKQHTILHNNTFCDSKKKTLSFCRHTIFIFSIYEKCVDNNNKSSKGKNNSSNYNINDN